MKKLKELAQYKELLKSNIKKEIRGKYKGSFLGVLWSFVNPLLMVTVYAIVFPFIMKSSEENYLIFLIVAIIPWTFFTTVVNQSSTTVIQNANIIKKVYFPREILPLSIVTSGLVNFLISCLIIFVFLIFSGIGFSINLIYLPIIILIQYVLLLAISFILSSVNVYIRDVEYIVNFVVMMLFYMTPILYPMSFIPERLKFLFNLNPMVGIINSYRDVLYYQVAPNWETLGILGLASVIIVYIGYKIFNKLEKGFAEEL